MSVIERDRQTVNDPELFPAFRPGGCARKAARATRYADPRMVFLARAAARSRLVASGDMTLDEAIEGLVQAFEGLRPCACGREIFVRMMSAASRHTKRKAP